MFLMLSSGGEIPVGYRVANVHDVTKFQTEARAAVTEEWGILALEDGQTKGSGYGYKVESKSFSGHAHTLFVIAHQGNHQEFLRHM